MKYAKVLLLISSFWAVSLLAQAPEGEATLPGENEVFSAPDEPPPPVPAPAPVTPTPEGAKEGEAPPEEKSAEEEMVYLNIQDQDIKEVIKQISKATKRNFIMDAKVTGKVTILSNKMMTKDEAYQAFLSALEVAGFTLVEGPGGILKIIALRDAKNYPIPTHIDTTPLTDSFVTRLIKLENINANAMSEAIKGLISRNGNLFAYPETNTLVLTDSGTNIDRLMKIIKELDQEGPQESVEIIPLHYASAKEVAGIVLSLFETQGGQARRPGGEGGAEAPKVSKIIADERTNAIIVLASKMAMEKVKELINRLDAKLEEGMEGRIHVHYLKHAKAKDIAAVLQNLAGAAKPAGAPAAGAPVVAELEEFKIASDDTTNSLLITSTPKTYNTLVDKVLSKLDIPRKQVYLEAMVVEFILGRSKALRLGTHGGVGAGAALGFGSTFNQFRNLFDPLNATANPGSPFINSPGLLGGILSRRRVNMEVTNADGTARTISVPAFSAFLTALATFGDTNIVASPSLLALDNEEATIEIIRKEPEPGQTTISATGLQQVGTPSRIEAGLTLKLTPQITEKGNVRMDIDQKFSFFATPQNAALGTQAIQERKVKTAVVTSDGQTVVIGGLMQDEVTREKTKVPLLGDIPLLGYLFKTTNSRKSKSNLILFITPHIIRDSSDFNKVLVRKMGQQDKFLNENFKPKEKSEIETTIKSHNAEVFDILGSRSSPGSLPSFGEPVITAKPEEEEPPLTIVIPADEKAARALEKRQREEEERQRREESTAQPPPPSSPPPASTGDHSPVITVPTGTPPPWEE